MLGDRNWNEYHLYEHMSYLGKCTNNEILVAYKVCMRNNITYPLSPAPWGSMKESEKAIVDA